MRYEFSPGERPVAKEALPVAGLMQPGEKAEMQAKPKPILESRAVYIKLLLPMLMGKKQGLLFFFSLV